MPRTQTTATIATETGTTCPLCQSRDTIEIDQTEVRAFRRCRNCCMVYVPAAFHLGPNEEKAIYDYHENDPADAGYRDFLARLSEPLKGYLPKSAYGLDFGCGPGPTLSRMLHEQGHAVENFDLYYQNKPELLERTFDFITSTEVVEHLRDPADTFRQLHQMLRPGGVLGLMTKLIPALTRFSEWHYTRDLTHICFYDRATFAFLAEKYRMRLEIIGKDVIIFTKS